MNEPLVKVGILTAGQVSFTLLTPFRCGNSVVTGPQTAVCTPQGICWQGKLADEWLFEPSVYDGSCFELSEVTIGIRFHWERQENQRFRGALRLIASGGSLTVINLVRAEDYLVSVISSEMRATASLEFLKAHAVISRSWLLAQLGSSLRSADCPASSSPSGPDGVRLRWYDHTDHTLFDVCADDHCQRYQGITRASTEVAARAVRETRGLVLVSDGQICDARFSKCCGGMTEAYATCWADRDFSYLTPVRDAAGAQPPVADLRSEAGAGQWIRSAPDAFCHTSDARILSQVLNDYDRETTDFYRWQQAYTRQELSGLFARKSGIDVGDIVDLIPLARGRSGRIWKLQVVGTRRTVVIGKELEIRRLLSPTHLYSSAFVVDKVPADAPVPDSFLLTGAGWGHGVGLCQIGAAVMSESGYTYEQILHHYYTGAQLHACYQ